MARTGEVMADILKRWEVDHLYGMPGDSINEFVEELRKARNELRFYQVRHEEVGALAAAAYAKLTGKLGVCLSIAGPGAVHLMNGLYDAKADGAPVLVIAGQVPTSKIGTDAFQEINLERMFEDASVYCKRADSHEQLPDMLNQAIRTAYAENGPAVLIVPDNLFAEKAEWDQPLTSDILASEPGSPRQKDMEMAAEMIMRAKKPVILAGKGALGAKEELALFAEKIGAPVAVSLPGKGAIPDTHPHCLGHIGQLGTKQSYWAMQETDLLIMIGTSYPYREFLPEKADAIQIDIETKFIGKRYPVACGLNGDSKKVLEALTAALPYQEDRTFLEEAQKRMAAWRDEMENDMEAETENLMPPQVMKEIQQVLTEDAILSVDVGNITVWSARYLDLHRQKMVISSWLATMGCGLPGAIAAKIAEPDKQVWALCGDGGFTMVMHDFVTAVKYKLPIVVVVFNNQKLGMIHYEQQEMGHIEYGTGLGNIDFAMFAEACGGIGVSIHNREEMKMALNQAVKADRPVILDVHVEEEPPLPGNISYGQAVHYTESMVKKFFSGKGVTIPPIGKSVKRLF
ncbi:pyruvate oxidase [Metabacillus mangrovi]|uniref:pyruvate oxidase n=1 Tax=Metabacillus mangrovi TaxID=1491830 RepID=UPI0030C88F28